MANDIDTGHDVARYTRLRQDPTHHWILPDDRGIRATHSTTYYPCLGQRTHADEGTDTISYPLYRSSSQHASLLPAT